MSSATLSSTPLNRPALSSGVKVTTIVFAALAAVGLIVTLILLFVTLASVDTEEFGWYFAFSVIASILNLIPAVVVLIMGIVSRRAASRVPLIGIVLGAVVLAVLAAQFIFLATV
ncbi:hypothetical protein N1027_09610 [Herbiconiux sp. CPCC 205763]|uniref:Major facilitator superfamily (MFS) profile domain-containing protein n=1 Tax=Herbiconiux aconitum TaxID=2970913 RepID=A0ABT2GQA5_9MICO|nr:hypothetical protein [Herbiconiux aconitum]MCS5718393.1 hypothetical protein [Herbiconiux aconitum]